MHLIGDDLHFAAYLLPNTRTLFAFCAPHPIIESDRYESEEQKMIASIGAHNQTYTLPVNDQKEVAQKTQDSHGDIWDGASRGKSPERSFDFHSIGSKSWKAITMAAKNSISFHPVDRQSWKKIKAAAIGVVSAAVGAVGGTLAVTAGGVLAPVVLGVTAAVTFAAVAGIMGGKQEGFQGLARGFGWACAGGAVGLSAGVALGIAGGPAAVIAGGVTAAVTAGLGGVLFATA
jgi:hypothetical protein